MKMEIKRVIKSLEIEREYLRQIQDRERMRQFFRGDAFMQNTERLQKAYDAAIKALTRKSESEILSAAKERIEGLLTKQKLFELKDDFVFYAEAIKDVCDQLDIMIAEAKANERE